MSQRLTPVLEAAIWMVGLGLMAWSDPTLPARIDLCLFEMLGVPFCPGEGLGHAIGFLARGEWALAWSTHKAAPLVVVVLLHRSLTLFHASIRNRVNHVEGNPIPA